MKIKFSFLKKICIFVYNQEYIFSCTEELTSYILVLSNKI